VNDAEMGLLREWQTPDSTYDVCFNEGNPNQILCAGGDGSLKLFDVANNVPVKIFKEHQGEVFGCEWNHINKKKILSASYDK
jgi:peroxin-7